MSDDQSTAKHVLVSQQDMKVLLFWESEVGRLKQELIGAYEKITQLQSENESIRVLNTMNGEAWQEDTKKLRESMADSDELLEVKNKEIARLRRGDFTEEEFQNLCHKFQDAERERFCNGCEAYQFRLREMAKQLLKSLSPSP